MELKETVELMLNNDYKARFVAEYWQLKIRYEKLKRFNTHIEAARRYGDGYDVNSRDCKEAFTEPTHDCPASVLCEQQSIMEQYLHLLELRAVYEGIDLEHCEINIVE